MYILIIEIGFFLAYGMTDKDMLLSFLAKEDDPNWYGRQMPQHFGCKDSI